MNVPALHSFLTGVATMGFLVAATFFARFWRETRDRLFLLFAVAFVALGLNRALLAVFDPGRESQPYLYIIRLGAFVLIAWAVIDKNRR
jgi:Family of unknown function (DUF5985)